MRWSEAHKAIEREDLAELKRLVAGGADITDPDHTGLTLLHHAVDIEADGAIQARATPEPAISEWLLEQGADPTRSDLRGVSAEDLARQYGYSAFLDLLARHRSDE